MDADGGVLRTESDGPALHVPGRMRMSHAGLFGLLVGQCFVWEVQTALAPIPAEVARSNGV